MRIVGRHCGGALVHAAYLAMFFPPAWSAVILLLPGSTFGTAEGYRMMAALMPETAWAGVSAAVAAFGLAAWLWGGTEMVLGALCLAAGWHAVVAALIFVANPLSVVPGSLLALAVLICLLVVRL